jgi:hypothetical protein
MHDQHLIGRNHMASQAQKDKAVVAAEKRLLVVAKRVEKLEKKIAAESDLDTQLATARKAVEVAQGEVDWAKSRPVLGEDVDEDVDEDELDDPDDDELGDPDEDLEDDEEE